MIHNCYLPRWLHRVCNGVFGVGVCLGLASLGFRASPDSWLYIGSRWLVYASVPIGAVLVCVAPRFSIVEGLGGGEGYDDLSSPGSANKDAR